MFIHYLFHDFLFIYYYHSLLFIYLYLNIEKMRNSITKIMSKNRVLKQATQTITSRINTGKYIYMFVFISICLLFCVCLIGWLFASLFCFVCLFLCLCIGYIFIVNCQKNYRHTQWHLAWMQLCKKGKIIFFCFFAIYLMFCFVYLFVWLFDWLLVSLFSYFIFIFIYAFLIY